MEKRFTTDEAIIHEYFKLYDVFGETKECSKEVKKLIKNITSEKQKLWSAILNGIIHGFKCNEKYFESYQELSKIYIEDKKSPHFIFVEREKLFAFANLDKKNKETTIQAYSKLLNDFSNSKDASIQLQVAQTMLTYSFLLSSLWGDLENAIQVGDELIKKFNNSKHIAIQTVIAKALNNKSHSLEKIQSRKGTESIKLREKIIDTYKDTKDIRMQLQVARSMFSNALSWQQMSAIEKIKNSQSEKIVEYAKNAIEAYSEIIEVFENSNIEKIQESIANSMYYIGNIQKEIDTQQTYIIYNELRKKFRDIDDNEQIIFQYVSATTDLVKILYDLGNNDVLDEILSLCAEIETIYRKKNKFKNNKDYIQIALKFCLEIQKNILQKQGNIDEFIKICKIIDEVDPTPFKQHLQALLNKKSILQQNGRYDEALATLDEIIVLYNHSQDEQIQKVVKMIIDEKEELQSHLIQIKLFEERQSKIREIFNFYSDNERNINKLIEYIKDKQITPLIGAGLSRFAGYPLWADFLDEIYENLPDDLKEGVTKESYIKKSCVDKATVICDDIFSNRTRFISEIKEHFKDNKMNLVSKEEFQEQAVYMLPTLFNGQLILTTNFDNLLQRVYEMNSCSINSVTAIDINKLDQLRKDKTLLYKVHGTIDIPKSVVLTKKDYETNYDENAENYKILKSKIPGNNILFLGCGLNEDDEILTFCRDGENYAIYPCDNKESINEVRRKLGKRDVIPILYQPQNKHADLKVILEYIAEKISEQRQYIDFVQNLGTQGVSPSKILELLQNNHEDTQDEQNMQGMSMGELMEKAKELQSKVAEAQESLGNTTLVGISEDKSVTVQMTGKYDITDFNINAEIGILSKTDLEKSILSALQDAKEQADKTIDDVMSKATEGMPMPE